ncbi:MAG: hypothetical protein ACK4NE_07350 [Albidovulum sp.]
MASAQIALTGFLLLATLIIIPPFIGVAAALRRMARLRRRGLKPYLWIRAGAAFALGALLVNLGIVAVTLGSRASGSIVLGRHHALAALLSWICLWFWIALLVFIRRRRHTGY